MSWKRPLFLLHRWAGIVLCLFFALWFLSGMFMMYVEFPQLTAPESRAGLRSLDFSSATLSPSDAVSRLRAGNFDTKATPSRSYQIEVAKPEAAVEEISRVQLGMLLDRPVYRVHVPDAQPRVVFADTGEVLQRVTPELAVNAATEFATRAGMKPPDVRYAGLVQTDQWTVSSALNAHRPLHRLSLGDEEDTQLYVSSITGEVVRDTRRLERVLNYFGAVTHWLYPTFIRRYPDAWEWMVDILSFAGTILATTGLWIGVLRWRRKRQPGKPAVPYRGLMRWHYFAGAGFGLFALTWVFSGLLSMNPASLNPSRSPSPSESQVFSGKALTAADFRSPPASFGPDVVAAELIHYAGLPAYRVTSRDGGRGLISAGETPIPQPDLQQLMSRAPALLPGIAMARSTVLQDYDDYYYTRRPERSDKFLPVLRVEFADSQSTWFHIDPITAEVLDRSTRTNRIYRWLYNGLHSWDIRWLWERRPLWDICVLSFSLGGLGLSLLGVVIGVRRLRYKYGAHHVDALSSRADLNQWPEPSNS